MAAVESNGHNPSPSFEDLFFDDKEPKVESMADRVPDLWPEIEVGNQEDSNSMRKRPPQWSIQTAGEQYLESLGECSRTELRFMHPTECTCDVTHRKTP